MTIEKLIEKYFKRDIPKEDTIIIPQRKSIEKLKVKDYYRSYYQDTNPIMICWRIYLENSDRQLIAEYNEGELNLLDVFDNFNSIFHKHINKNIINLIFDIFDLKRNTKEILDWNDCR